MQWFWHHFRGEIIGLQRQSNLGSSSISYRTLFYRPFCAQYLYRMFIKYSLLLTVQPTIKLRILAMIILSYAGGDPISPRLSKWPFWKCFCKGSVPKRVIKFCRDITPAWQPIVDVLALSKCVCMLVRCCYTIMHVLCAKIMSIKTLQNYSPGTRCSSGLFLPLQSSFFTLNEIVKRLSNQSKRKK